MLQIRSYDRTAAVDYAHRWAYGRNPAYYDFEEIGGDCTNFASQCLFAGTGIMDWTPIFGWYYVNLSDRAPAWTGVPYFADFLTRGKHSPGPFADWCEPSRAEPGDFLQIGRGESPFSHTLIVVESTAPHTPENILVAAHSYDADDRPLSTYEFDLIRGLHILGAYEETDRRS